MRGNGTRAQVKKGEGKRGIFVPVGAAGKAVLGGCRGKSVPSLFRTGGWGIGRRGGRGEEGSSAMISPWESREENEEVLVKEKIVSSPPSRTESLRNVDRPRSIFSVIGSRESTGSHRQASPVFQQRSLSTDQVRGPAMTCVNPSHIIIIITKLLWSHPFSAASRI